MGKWRVEGSEEIWVGKDRGGVDELDGVKFGKRWIGRRVVVWNDVWLN